MESEGRVGSIVLLAAVLAAAVTALFMRLHFERGPRRLLNHIIDYADTAILTTTPDFIITGWNPAAQRALGYTAMEVVGKSATMLVPADQLQEALAVKQELLVCNSTDIWETRRVHKNGSII